MVKKVKKGTALLIFLCLTVGLCACGNSKTPEKKDADVKQAESDKKETESGAEETQDPANDTLVVYFSATGTTKGVAEKIADITGADLYEIIPAEKYSAKDLDYNDSSSRTSVEMNDPNARPDIGSEKLSLDGYSTLYIGYPIWWVEAPRIMSTFVESYGFDGLTVIPFCTSGSSAIGKSGETLAEQAEGGTWLSGERFGADVSESELQTWIDGLQ